MKRSFPARRIEDVPESDPIFHTAYDVRERYQVGNFRSMLRNGNTYRADGDKPYWRGVRDDKGRVVVAITFNNDLGDSWQLADNPQYPQKFSYLGIRMGIDFLAPRIAARMKMADPLDMVADVAHDIPVHDLRVIDVVENLHARRIHPLHHVDAPGDVVEHVVLVVHLAVQVLDAEVDPLGF